MRAPQMLTVVVEVEPSFASKKQVYAAQPRALHMTYDLCLEQLCVGITGSGLVIRL